MFLASVRPSLNNLPGHFSGIALGYGLDDRVFESRQGLGIFFFTTTSRSALGPTQPPIQLVPGAVFLRIKRPRRETEHLSHLVPSPTLKSERKLQSMAKWMRKM